MAGLWAYGWLAHKARPGDGKLFFISIDYNRYSRGLCRYLVKQGCIPAMVNALKTEPSVIINTLQALDKMLKVC